MAKAKAGETLRAAAGEVVRLTAEGVVAADAAAVMRLHVEAADEEIGELKAALKQARLTLMGHGFDVAYIDAVLT